MNSQVIREISQEGTSGLWRVGFMEKKGFEARMKKCRGDGTLEESGDAESGKLRWSRKGDESGGDRWGWGWRKSQEVDSRDEVMHVGKSDQWFLEYSGTLRYTLNKKLSYRLENRASATYFFVAKLISIAHSCL